MKTLVKALKDAIYYGTIAFFVLLMAPVCIILAGALVRILGTLGLMFVGALGLLFKAFVYGATVAAGTYCVLIMMKALF